MFDEKEGLPDLPPSQEFFGGSGLRESDNEEEEESESQALPAFPDSPSHNRFSEAAIKDAIRGNDEESLPELPKLPGEEPELPELEEIPGLAEKTKIVEMEEWKPERPNQVEISRREDFAPFRKEGGAPDVFVKIEKFRTARRTFNEVKSKLDEIDDLIKRIRETKMREDQELNSWERDVTQIKSKVRDVSENIFEKVE
ncbi:hypothetical protein J4402_02795 [Candidatus Pacearchaeota archaeon]|nr:hypothetical protein [Candidatus Pacearchaeota archaeon]